MAIISPFHPFKGQHCETTATGTLLKNIGIDLSEPMLFGLGEGLGYIFWFAKNMDFPFIGGRNKPDSLTHNLAKNLNLNLHVKETTSVNKAWSMVKEKIDNNIPVGLKLDCYHLDYFKKAFHFAAHYAAMYGYDDEFAYMVDTMNQGSTKKTSLKALEKARSEKGPMSSNNLMYTIEGASQHFNLKEALKTAIRNNAMDYLNPPISNIGYRGIEKTSKEFIKQIKAGKINIDDLATTSILMERGGTGGAVFRNMYSTFLKESYGILTNRNIHAAYELFAESADTWNTVIKILEDTARQRDLTILQDNAALFPKIATLEKQGMELLSKV